MNKCPVCDEKFDDEEEFQEHIKSHEDESILNAPNFVPKIAGKRMKFTKRMQEIIQQDMPKDWNRIINVSTLFHIVNGKLKQRGSIYKWELLEKRYPQIAKTAWKKYQEKFKDDLGFVTLDNFSDTKILEEKAEIFLREEATKPKKKKKVGRTTKIEQRLDDLEKRVAELEN